MSLLFTKLLLRRVQETYGSSIPSINDVVDGLRAKYPEYCRHKPQLFTTLLKQTLHNNGKRKLPTYHQHLPAPKKTTPTPIQSDSQSSHSESTEESKSQSSDSDSSRTVLTSEDDLYNDPAFDITKSTLRNKYTQKPKTVELELVTDREKKKVNLVMEAGKAVKPVAKLITSHKPKGLSSDNGEEDKDDGPWFKDLGGMDDVLGELKKNLILPLYNPKVACRYRVSLMGGILLHGPPGCGKTKLAHAIANESGLPFYHISATKLVSGVSGGSEENIRDLFSKAYKTAPSIVFIDEIDAIASKRENLDREMERRMVTQLMTCMGDRKQGYVLVIGATNRPDAIDPALRRPGRFDREFKLGVPDENARIKILSALTRNIQLEGAFDLLKLARSTPGFVGADLEALVKEAGYIAMQRTFERKLEHSTDNEDWWRKAYSWTPEEMTNCNYTMSDFEAAAKLVQPSLTREGFTSIPDVTWEDVGGLDLLRSEFYDNIVAPLKYPDLAKKFGLDSKTGFLLYGPPGCGKTLIAKAVANEAGVNFIHIQGPELLNKYVGESELALRTIFSRARTCSPCILFFDEIDTITKDRGKDGGVVGDRLLNQLLIELDGGDRRKGVYVIAATNRPNTMDVAVLRPGRLGRLMYVPLPNRDERELILKALSRNKTLDADVDLGAFARSKACENLSGADLEDVIHIAATVAFKEAFTNYEEKSMLSSESYIDDMSYTIKAAHLELALRQIKRSISDKVKRRYKRMSKRFSAS
ncbi:hypothetical protein M8C21_025449 [Ambrosia artemisiifolia]|uniref:AAA+ ATPase domain-containing protein n=1 Tax=Ambrosia artemisiifolia TaxID=4212 RepID=A0AAD5D1I1_AMBAR|nr:hypothetical protein M8C21_025449 [Ambrosia artemisiifolia]